ncbi:MAG: undecaprenyl-diphosphate phosphatase [Nitrososphaerota archaeon]
MLIYIFLGILQGILEWIPISSEGIIALISNFLIENANPIDIALFSHIGTLLVILIYFRKDWKEVLIFKNIELLKFLIISNIISLIVAFPIYNVIKDIVIGNSLLIITGFGLIFTSYFHKSKRKIELSLNEISIISGFLQGLSVIPGFSRSGSTIFGLSLGKLSPSEILKISYMMSAPAILASTIYLFLKNPILIESWPVIISSFFIGMISLHFLIRISKKMNFYKFTLIFALLCFIGAIINFI